MTLVIRYIIGVSLLFISATTLLALALYTFCLLFPEVSNLLFSAALFLSVKVVTAIALPCALGWVGWLLVGKG